MPHTKYYCYYIKLIKYSVLTSIIAIIYCLVYTVHDNLNAMATSGKASQIVRETNGVPETSSESIIKRPKFFGISNDNKPYKLFSKEGAQINKDLVLLTDIYSDIELKEGFIIMKADKAKFQLQDNNLEVYGNVRIAVGDDYTINTNNAYINYKKKSSYGNQYIKIENKVGEINADEFQVTENHKELILKGRERRVKTIINK